MAYETLDGEGCLFTNDKKTREAQPDYRGHCKINGVMYEIAGWKQTGKKSGMAFLSLQITSLEEAERGRTAASKLINRAAELHPAAKTDVASDDLPF